MQTTEATEPSGLGKLGISPDIFIAQLVNFLIVLFVLWKFAYKPIMKTLDERSKRIEEGLKNAQTMEERLAALEMERTEVIKKAQAEATKVLEAAQADAEDRKKDMIEKAKREVERVVVNGKAQLKNEQEAMLREARKEMAEIAVAAAKKILSEGVDAKKASSLAEEVIRKAT